MFYDARIMQQPRMTLKELAALAPFLAWAVFLTAADHGFIALVVASVGVGSSAIVDALQDGGGH